MISSSENSRFRRWKKLKTTRGRKKEKAYLVESRKLVSDLLESGAEVEAILLLEGRADAFLEMERNQRRFLPQPSESHDSRQAWERRSPEKIFLPEKLFMELSSMETPDGILAVVRGRPGIHIESLRKSNGTKENSVREKNGNYLLLDHIQDPGNLGAILRSAEAFGYRQILLLECADTSNPKTLRASMGSVFRLTYYEMHPNELLPWKSNCPFLWIGADMKGESVSSFSWPQQHVLIIGNEGRGISPELREHIDRYLMIPMEGKAESLNAAVSASILMAFQHLSSQG
ncbi:MAG: RNA methyltransferase [Peptoniphilaceae bacterium]|nr:RNA methyltransferase [Peptoniphilaceae bacterium]